MVKSASQPCCVNGKCCSESYYEMKPEPGKTIDSWDALLNFYRSSERSPWKKRWIFRGHKDSSWCLETTLERAIRRQLGSSLDTEAINWEYKLERYFQRIAPMFLPEAPKEDNWIEWRALIRHYGGPARLLDWTYSFFVAVFLAMQEAKDDEHCAVWAYNVDWWKKRVVRRIPKLGKIVKAKNSKSEIEFNYLRKLKGKKGIWPVNPFRLNERLHAQQGVFLMPLDASSSFMENLRDLATPTVGREHLWKINLSCNKTFRKECIAELQRMNIQNQTLFRGLDGLARDLENKMLMPEHFKDIEPKL